MEQKIGFVEVQLAKLARVYYKVYILLKYIFVFRCI